jgi:hypothetical protein
MVILYKLGFEEGVIPPEVYAEVSEGNTLEVVNVNPRSGIYSCHVNCPVGQGAYLVLSLSPQQTLFVDLPILLAKPLDTGKYFTLIAFIQEAPGVGWVRIASVRMRNTGTEIMLELAEEFPIAKEIDVSVTLEPGAYHSIQLGFDKVTGKYNLYLDYTLIASDIVDLTGAPDVNLIAMGNGWTSGTPEFYMDDITVATEEIPGIPPTTYGVTINTVITVEGVTQQLPGVPIDIDGTIYNSPVDTALPAGTHTIKAANTYVYQETTYYFVAWSDGDKSSLKTIDLQGNWGADILYGTTPPETHMLTITTTEGGTTDPAPGAYEYSLDSIIKVTAIPNAGYVFSKWFVDADTVLRNPTYIPMTSDHLVKAVFSIQPKLSTKVIAGAVGVATAVAAGLGYALSRRKK